MGLRGPHLPASRGVTEKLGDTGEGRKLVQPGGRDMRGVFQESPRSWSRKRCDSSETDEGFRGPEQIPVKFLPKRSLSFAGKTRAASR